MTTYHTIVTHVRPHLDEILAILFVLIYGEKLFPGVSTAGFQFWNAGHVTPDGRSADEYEKEGYLLIGVGGSRFDEHATFDEGRREGECAASLMAHELGLSEDPCFMPLLEYATANDIGGGAGKFADKAMARKATQEKTRDDSGAFHLAALVNMMNASHPDNPARVIEWTKMALEAYIAQQLKFHGETREVYDRCAVIREIATSHGPSIRMASIESDLESLGRFSRSQFAKGGPADIFIQKRSTGHVQIFTNKRSKVFVNIRDIVRMIRFKEQVAKRKILTRGFKELGAEGTVLGAEEWHFHEKGGMLLNGSLSAPTVPVTQIKFDTILRIVRTCLDQTQFEQKHQNFCEKGTCTHRTDPCSWYDYGLQRCQSIRYKGYQASEVIPATQIVRKTSQAATS